MLIRQVLLVLAAGALCAAALRLAARICGYAAGSARSSVVELVLVAAPLAAALAVVWTLLLGLAGLAGSAVALAAGPIVVWAVVRWLPICGPGLGLAAELARRWERAPRAQRTLALAVLGAAVGCVLEIAREPAFDVDALSYHLADVVGWIHSGHAGAVQNFSYDFPVGNYPITNEVLLTWPVGIARSFAPVAIVATAQMALLLLALWRLLTRLRVPGAVVLGSLTALGSLPILLVGINLNAPGTDMPAVAWLACAAALCAGALDTPALLCPALLAGGLGIGTKTTVAPLIIVVLATGVWIVRARLSSVRWWLAAGAAAGLVVGAPWYVRNAIDHGWPLWPFSSGPTGDPIPHTLTLFENSFLSRPLATVRVIGHEYLYSFAGGLGVIAAVALTPLLVRSRMTLLVCAVALAAVLSWALAPFTGLGRYPQLEILAVSTVRYMLAAIAACLVALGIAARDGPPLMRRLVIVVLAGATGFSVYADTVLGYPTIPRLSYALLGAVLAALLGAFVPLSVRRLSNVSLLLAPGALLAVLFLTLSAPGWFFRESEDRSYDHVLLGFMLAQPGFNGGSQPVSSAPSVLASLAGPHLSHPIDLIPAGESCRQVRARLRRGWIVVWPKAYVRGITTYFAAPTCLIGQHPVYDDGTTLVYGPQA